MMPPLPAPPILQDLSSVALLDEERSKSLNYLPSKFSFPVTSGLRNRKHGKTPLTGKEEVERADVDDSKDSHDMRWNGFKWTLLIANILLMTYSILALIFCLITWFNIWTHADVIRAGNRTELALSGIAAFLGIFASLLGWAGILLNDRPFLAVYTFLLWIVFAFLTAVGYTAYHRRTYNLFGKLSKQWSRDLGTAGRLRVQNQLGCCGYFSPFVEATVSQTCYARSPLPGCALPYLEFQRDVLRQWYIAAFALTPFHIGVIVAGLLCSNHVTRRFGKGMMPEAYRFNEISMKAIMAVYARQLEEVHGQEVATEILTKSHTKMNRDIGTSRFYDKTPKPPPPQVHDQVHGKQFSHTVSPTSLQRRYSRQRSPSSATPQQPDHPQPSHSTNNSTEGADTSTTEHTPLNPRNRVHAHVSKSTSSHYAPRPSRPRKPRSRSSPSPPAMAIAATPTSPSSFARHQTTTPRISSPKSSSSRAAAKSPPPPSRGSIPVKTEPRASLEEPRSYDYDRPSRSTSTRRHATTAQIPSSKPLSSGAAAKSTPPPPHGSIPVKTGPKAGLEEPRSYEYDEPSRSTSTRYYANTAQIPPSSSRAVAKSPPPPPHSSTPLKTGPKAGPEAPRSYEYDEPSRSTSTRHYANTAQIPPSSSKAVAQSPPPPPPPPRISTPLKTRPKADLEEPRSYEHDRRPRADRQASTSYDIQARRRPRSPLLLEDSHALAHPQRKPKYVP